MGNLLAGQIGLLAQAADPALRDLARYAVIAAVALLILYAVWRIVHRRRPEAPPDERDLAIDVASLSEKGPPSEGPALEHYYVPVRLAAVVLAPAGRAGRVPSLERQTEVFEAIVPGLGQVVLAHRPLVRRWPEQLSTSGFAHAFFRLVKLPGDAGKGTAWCSAAGVAKPKGGSVMVGLVMRAEAENNFSQTIIERDTKWLDVLRVRRSEG
jgi:hypothetical protein